MSETTTQTAQDMPVITLEPPAPVPVIAPDKAAGLVSISGEQRTQLDERVDGFIDALVSADANSPEFGQKVDQITNMGRAEIAAAAGQANRFLDRPARALDQEGTVGSDLVALRQVVEKLDPSRQGMMEQKKFLGIIPYGGSVKTYFDKYESAQGHISNILLRLGNGKTELLKDNGDIDVERQNLWAAMGRLEQMVHVAKTLDERLEAKAAELDATDPAKAKAIRESALFYVRQRRQDILTQLAVSVQGYLALDLVKKNNVELIKGVDRASTTTVGALRTAVTVASAMANQRLVLDQITALNTTTAKIIDSTGELLKENTGRIHEQAAASTIPMETLQRAFQNIYDTMDAVDTFKLKALDSMKTTIDTLSVEVEKSRGYIARAEGQAQAQAQVASGNNPLAALEG
ncbi:MAG: toxic anion resistance protein [Sphingopyxis sp.]|nr:toxic anion resistance protein [Sphingopyxis sp.]